MSVLGDLGPRRPHGAQRHAGDRVVLRVGLHDPAAAVAADRAGRDAGPLPARRRLDPADPRPIDVPIGVAPGAAELPALAAGAGTPSRAVRFEDVSFAYGDGRAGARRADAGVGAGETHAIVGATGAGKSTLVKLLLRLYDAQSGSVTVDGVEVADLSFASLRGAIGYVGQDTFLFDGTVAENLRYGAPDADDDELRRAAELAEAHEFVMALPKGYDTQVGERGVRLSGGQRQRLTIARALGARPVDPGARRGDLGGRQRDRGGDPALAAARQPSAHDDRHRPPPVDDSPRRRDPRPAGRAGRRARDARRAGRDGRPLRRAVGGADR